MGWVGGRMREENDSGNYTFSKCNKFEKDENTCHTCLAKDEISLSQRSVFLYYRNHRSNTLDPINKSIKKKGITIL